MTWISRGSDATGPAQLSASERFYLSPYCSWWVDAGVWAEVWVECGREGGVLKHWRKFQHAMPCVPPVSWKPVCERGWESGRRLEVLEEISVRDGEVELRRWRRGRLRVLRIVGVVRLLLQNKNTCQ